jgi:molybdate transport system substrate-binding protein
VTSPTELKVLSTTAMKMVFESLAPAFERGSGCRLAIDLGPSLQLEKRLREGESADVAIVTRAGAEDLMARGMFAAGSLVDVARSLIGVCVAKGSAWPDLSSAESFKQAMRNAKSIALSKPVGGGASGAHMAKVFDRLGISAEIEAKAKYGVGGAKGLAALAVLHGEAEIGIQQMAELLAVPEIDVVGPLPPALQAVTQFTAAVPSGAAHGDAARALIGFLGSPAAKSVIKAKGLEPN